MTEVVWWEWGSLRDFSKSILKQGAGEDKVVCGARGF